MEPTDASTELPPPAPGLPTSIIKPAPGAHTQGTDAASDTTQDTVRPEETEPTPETTKKALNVIIFGETGVGKSSLINQILGYDEASTSAGAEGCTFSSTCYSNPHGRQDYDFHDTAGINEGSASVANMTKSATSLRALVDALEDSGGVHLLVLVVKCGRVTGRMKKNYDLFYKSLCSSNVPIVIVVTGCEDIEPSMDSWWEANESLLAKAGMKFQGHACVCTYKGRKLRMGNYSNEEPFEESKGKVVALIRAHCLETGWQQPRLVWFQRILKLFLEMVNKSHGIPAITRSVVTINRLFHGSNEEPIGISRN